MLIRCVFTVVVLVLSVGFNSGQVFDNRQNSKDWNEQIHQLSFLNRTDSEYQLGSGDLIEVSIFGIEDFKYNLRINSRGEITLPFVGTVDAAGVTPAELELTLKGQFETDLIHNAQVSVFVQEYRSQPVFVLGAVAQPGQYQIIYQLNLVDVLAMAGGLIVDKAADRATVQRPAVVEKGKAAGTSSGEVTANVVTIDLKSLFEDGDLSLNIPIQGGDVVHVPERKVNLFFVVGEVNRSGVYEIPPKNDIFVSQAIAWAGGPMKTAKLNKGILVRYEGNGERQEMTVNFEDIMKGKANDFAVQPNDIVFIPGSTFKTIGYGLLGVIPATASGALIYGTVR